MRRMWLPVVCLAVISCSGGTSPTAPTATASVPGGASQTAATYTLSGTVFPVGGPAPFPMVVSVAGGPSTVTDATGRFVLAGVPVSLQGAPLRIGDRPLSVGYSATAGQNVHLEIRLDLTSDTATVTRFCTDAPATEVPGSPPVSLSMCVGPTS